MVILPDNMPIQIARLPKNKAGYPIPWFVEKVNGEPDFRVVSLHALTGSIGGRCWICGEMREGIEAFVAGPMCAVNRTSAEPPSHLLCARWAAIACPFLARPEMSRRESGLPEGIHDPGVMITRNPGVTVVWKTRPGRWSTFRSGVDLLFNMGEPIGAEWYARGRMATREEVITGIESGFPAIYKVAYEDGDTDALAEMLEAAMRLVPA